MPTIQDFSSSVKSRLDILDSMIADKQKNLQEIINDETLHGRRMDLKRLIDSMLEERSLLLPLHLYYVEINL
jgi:hypothetical protein